MFEKRLQTILRMTLLVALEVVLSRFLSINTPYLKIGFAFVPLAIAGALYGPWGGMAVGGVADLLGATLFPSGPFFPGFTLSALLRGMVYGLCLQGGGIGNWKRIAVAVSFNAVVISLGLNTVWIHLLYGAPIPALLATRALQELLVVPVQLVVLRVLGTKKLWEVLA